MPLATIHTRGLIPDFVISPILSPSLSTLSTDSYGEELHALHVSTILQKIFSYLSFWNQKKCRLVCKNWKDELEQSMRFRSISNLTKIIGSISPGYPSALPSSLLPINLVCTSFIIENSSQETANLLRHLDIKYVELRNISWQCVVKYLRLMPYLEELRIAIQCLDNTRSNSVQDSNPGPPVLERLRKLVVTYNFKDFHVQASSINALLEILQKCPNLETIYFPNILQFTSPYDNPARVLFKNIIHNGSIMRMMTSLQIDTFITNEDLYTLAERNFPLKSLQLTLTPSISCIDLYELLYSVEHTLEDVTLTLRDGYRLSKKFPSDLKRLKNLSIILWNGYLDNFPEKIQKLVVVLMELEMEMIPKAGTVEQLKIPQLEIYAVPKGSESMIIKTLRISPGDVLKRLTIDFATDQYLRVIFRSLRSLEELVILNGNWTETGLTGIPKAYCKLENIVNKEFYAVGLKEYPGITDLKQIRRLSLTGVLTDIAVLFITKCKNIRCLELVPLPSSKVSKYSLVKLADTMDLDYLRMTGFTNEEGLHNTFRQRFSGRELYLDD